MLMFNQREKKSMKKWTKGTFSKTHFKKRLAFSLPGWHRPTFCHPVTTMPGPMLSFLLLFFSLNLSPCIYLYLICNFKELQKAPLNSYLPLFSNYVFSTLPPVCTGICVDQNVFKYYYYWWRHVWFPQWLRSQTLLILDYIVVTCQNGLQKFYVDFLCFLLLNHGLLCTIHQSPALQSSAHKSR